MIKNVIQYLELSAETTPDHIAIVDRNSSITFRQLRDRSRQVANTIIKQTGKRQNTPIAVMMPKTIESVVAYLAIVYSGNFYVPIDMSSPKERVDKILEVLQPEYCIVIDYINLLSENLQISIKDCIDEQFDSIEINNILARKIDTDPLYVLFTSGSTGIPKGVIISHKSVIDYVEWLTDFFGFDNSAVFGNQAPFHFDNSILDIYTTLKNGSTMVIIPEELFLFPKKLLKYMADKAINTIFWVPSALTLVTKAKREYFINEGLKLSKILFCGEVMPVKTLNFWRVMFPEALFVNLYGPTEITDVCCCYVVNREFKDEESLPIGFPCNNTDIFLLNQNDKLVTGNDEEGELCVRGTCLAYGYFSDQERTNQVFVRNPLNDKYEEKIYRTGDIAKYNESGELIYIGRKDFQIKHMGYRIELGEIEAVAGAIDELNEVCCIYNDIKKEIVLVCTCNEKVDEKYIYSNLAGKLPKYMLPSLIKVLKELPHTSNCKIDRKQIKQQFS
ncbi:amino acid adenylation domain-containing protein [Aminipila sp.]|uniref:amino acid adenylation domain-containing protein n=1 Tax=Aminipila sp. TaxID=2060095 RepID=UPI0028A23BF8|nr:amino acid adenylation domain-containing protein [Aminipila sp.]